MKKTLIAETKISGEKYQTFDHVELIGKEKWKR